MDPSSLSDRAGIGPYLAIAVIFAVVALSLAWLQVEGVIDPAATQIVNLGMGAVVVVVVLRVLELYGGRTD